ncbi:ankyrin repeat-containing domain protein [Tricladium varicosporioides]|nr:ankyrin repeat-containing domain protein [Hymenoscyphus varicosporioides]
MRDLVPGTTTLHTLAKSYFWWQVDGLKYLIGKGAIVDVKDADRQTPLHIACRPKVLDQLNIEYLGFWKPSVVEVLPENGADSNALGNEGRTPLHHAFRSVEIMEILVNNGVNCAAGTTSPLLSALSSLKP